MELHVQASRPALLWLAAEGTVVENITSQEANNRHVSATVMSDGELSVRVRTNYDYWLTITTSQAHSSIFGANTGLKWQELSRDLLPGTVAGERVSLTLEWHGY